MRTDISATVALNTLLRIPNGELGGDSSLFIHRGPHCKGAALVPNKCADRQGIPPLSVDGNHDFSNHFWQITQVLRGFLCIFPCFRDLYAHRTIDAGIHRCKVHVDDPFALFSKGLLGGRLHIVNSVLYWNDFGEIEKCSLQDHAGLISQTQVMGDFVGIHNIELDIVFGHVPLDLCRDALFKILRGPGTVQQERATGLKLMNHIIFV